MDNQLSIFDVIYKKYKLSKPIRLIELFGGYGSQSFSLKYLGIKFEHWKLCEWAVKSIQAYKDAHFFNDSYKFDETVTKEVLVDWLFKKGISFDYNKPATYDEIKRKSFEELKTITSNIKITNNLVNIQNVKGTDLEIKDTDKYEYIMTYSFPCQDLSLAGKGKGMDRDSGTRSGMLWEVERMLDELKNNNMELPQILLMENVPQVIGTENVANFNEWQLKLEQLGYKNYHKNLIATDYGIPQTRNRTFMVSILGEYSYTFPKPIPLKLKLKDMLEDNVDEKYYLSDKMSKYIFSFNDKYKVNINSLKLDREIAVTKTTREGNTRADSSDYITIPEATKKGYALAKDGDGVYINRPHQKRGVVQKEKIQTLKTSGNDVGVVVDNDKKLIDNPLKNNTPYGWHFEQNVFSENSCVRTLKSSDGSGNKLKVISNLRIRKLTPKECFRLMGVKDEDYERIAKNQSDSSLYHLAGDSIVTTVLMAIFGELLGIDWKSKIEE